jgi:hypothetical protein
VVRPGPLEAGIPVDNPLGIAGLPRQVADLLVELFVPAVSAAGLAAAVALIVRYRRAGPVERQQLKWFISAVTAWAAVLPFAFVANTNVLAIVALTALALVPISVVIAILRYRLYEIDTLINRTLVYVPLVGIVAGLYAGCVALLQRAFVAVTGDTSDAAAVISALILAAVFTPIRNSLQSVVDARFKAASSGDPPSAPDRSEPALGAAIQSLVARMDRTEVKMETYLSEHGRIHEDLTSAFARVEERLVTSTGQPMPREDAPIGEGRSTAPGPVPLSPDSQNDGSSRTRTRRGTSDG